MLCQYCSDKQYSFLNSWAKESGSEFSPASTLYHSEQPPAPIGELFHFYWRYISVRSILGLKESGNMNNQLKGTEHAHKKRPWRQDQEMRRAALGQKRKEQHSTSSSNPWRWMLLLF